MPLWIHSSHVTNVSLLCFSVAEIRVKINSKEDDMPLKRLSDATRPDGTVPIGAMCKRVQLEDLGQEVWAKVSVFGRKAQVTISYMAGVKANTPIIYEDHRFRIERVLELGLREQIRLECSVA
jgi:hypothetical protein